MTYYRYSARYARSKNKMSPCVLFSIVHDLKLAMSLKRLYKGFNSTETDNDLPN